jgi:tetratricopeptide (TPR) repeat protein
VVLLALAGLGLLGVAAWPEIYLRSAHRALAAHAYDAARESLDRYLEARPRSAEAHLLLAQLDRRANRTTEAVQHLDACAREGGPADAIELERGLLAIQNGVYNAQLDALCSRHLARPDADQYLILEALSQGLTKTYRLKEALVCLDRMLVLQPDSGFALRRRAWVYSQLEHDDRAEADYRQALTLDPDDRTARLGLAQLLLNIRKDGRLAAEHFERLLPVQQDSTVVLGLAQSWRLIGQGDKARQLLDDWLTRHPGDAAAMAERGRLALDDQATDQAITLLRRAVALAPYLPDAYYTLSLALSQKGHKAEAEVCKERMQQAREEAKAAKVQLADLTKRLQETTDDADLRCEIGKIFLRYGEEEGERWLVTNLQNHPGHRPSYLALADYYEKLGQPERGAEYRRRANVPGLVK